MVEAGGLGLRRAAITGTGRAFPERVVPNAYFYDDLGLDTNEEWIRSRTGVHTRHFADATRDETTAALAARAGLQALERAGVGPAELDGVIVATITPDHPFPSTACLVQERLGAANAWAFDLGAACSGYLFGLAQAAAAVRSRLADRVLVIGAEVMSSILDFENRDTCILFGDGAGATLVEAADDGRGYTIGAFRMRADGSGAPMLQQPAGGCRRPASLESVAAREHFVHQDGRNVFKHAVQHITAVIQELLESEGLGIDDVALVVPHQANIRIIEACWRRLEIPPQRVVVTVDRWANTTAATIPTSLDFAAEQGRIHPGDRVVLATFGAGFTWGAGILEC